MATTTTNYGFDVPTSSDLVKNGATQIALLGQDLDTFLFRPFNKNLVINGGMDIWQRGTSIAASGSSKVYTADRWSFWRGGLATGATVTRQGTADTTNLPFVQYCARVQRDSGNTSTQAVKLASDMESVNTIPYAGKAVTVTFYARKGANYSVTASDVNCELLSGTGTDQQIINGYTGQTTVASGFQTITTTWQRFTVTGTVPATSTQLGIVFSSGAPVGTAGANDYFEVTGVQVEAGTQSTPFSRNAETIQGELAACQRYYCRWTGGAAYHPYGLGFATSTTAGAIIVNSPVAMRVAPTTIDYSTIYLEDYASASSTAGTVSAFNAGPLVTKLNFTGLSGMTAGRGIYIFSNNDANGYLAFSAEL
jgi:hypothetical protein